MVSESFRIELRSFVGLMVDWRNSLLDSLEVDDSPRPDAECEAKLLVSVQRVYSKIPSDSAPQSSDTKLYDWFKSVLDCVGITCKQGIASWNGVIEADPAYGFAVKNLIDLLDAVQKAVDIAKYRASVQAQREMEAQHLRDIATREQERQRALERSAKLAKRTTFIEIWELSDRLGLPCKWLKSEIKAGRLPHILIGRKYFFHFATVEQALLTRFLPVQTEAVDESNQPHLLASTG